MNAQLRASFTRELAAGNAFRSVRDFDSAFRHFERAHILGQRSTIAHARAHVGMLRIGWARRDLREILGQLSRIVAALLFSRIWVPVGNTGGANVSAFRAMPVPDDLSALLGDTSKTVASEEAQGTLP